MNKKIWGLMLTGLSTLVLLLFLICMYADVKAVPDTLFLFPKTPMGAERAAGNIRSIEERNGEDFLLTYESSSSVIIHGLNSRHDGILKETNHMYPYVMNTAVAAGSFFTEEAQKANQKQAVLNKKSAFDIFGCLDIADGEMKINGETYTVIGVIDDRDKKNLNIYVPLDLKEADIAGGRVDSFSVLMDGSGETPEAAVESKLKQYNIDSSDFHFYNLNQFVGGFRSKLLLAVNLLLLLMLIVFMGRSLKIITKQFMEIKRQRDHFDFGELVQACRRPIGKMLLYLLGDIAMVTASVVIVGKAAGYLLELQDNTGRMVNDYSAGFTATVNMFNQLSWYSQTVFAVFLIMLALFAGLLALTCVKPRKGGKE